MATPQQIRVAEAPIKNEHFPKSPTARDRDYNDVEKQSYTESNVKVDDRLSQSDEKDQEIIISGQNDKNDKFDTGKKTKHERKYFAQIARECTIVHETAIVLGNTVPTKVAQLIAPRKMTRKRSVFSIRILKAGESGGICIGLVPEKYEPNCMPGCDDNSIGYFEDDGDMKKRIANTAKDGDVISFDIDIDKNIGTFRKNGEECKELNLTLDILDMYPCIAIRSLGGAVQILQHNLWKTDAADETPEALPTCKFDNLWISPAKNLIMTERDRDVFFGWVVCHNPRKVPVAFRVMFGRKPEQSYIGVLDKKEDWIKQLEVEREDILDSILVEWKVLKSENRYNNANELKLIFEEGEYIKNKESCHQLLVELQESNKLEDDVSVVSLLAYQITLSEIKESDWFDYAMGVQRKHEEPGEDTSEKLQRLLQKHKYKKNAAETDKTVRQVKTMMIKAKNLDIQDENGCSLLHLSASYGLKRVAGLLLDYNANPHLTNYFKEYPLQTAIHCKNDEIAELLVRKMNSKSVFNLFWPYSNGNRNDEDEPTIQLTIKQLLRDNLEKTALAVLDTFQTRHGTYWLGPLEVDDHNRGPNHPMYNAQDLTAYQMIARDNKNEFLYHGSVKTLTHIKWNLYAWKRLLMLTLIYLLSLFAITFAAVTGVATDDVTTYNAPIDVARGLFELLAYIYAVLILFGEVIQVLEHKIEYLKDVFNYMEFVSSALTICVLPLRYAQRQEQWYVFSLGYLLWGFRIFKYAALFE